VCVYSDKCAGSSTSDSVFQTIAAGKRAPTVNSQKAHSVHVPESEHAAVATSECNVLNKDAQPSRSVSPAVDVAVSRASEDTKRAGSEAASGPGSSLTEPQTAQPRTQRHIWRWPQQQQQQDTSIQFYRSESALHQQQQRHAVVVERGFPLGNQLPNVNRAPSDGPDATPDPAALPSLSQPNLSSPQPLSPRSMNVCDEHSPRSFAPHPAPCTAPPASDCTYPDATKTQDSAHISCCLNGRYSESAVAAATFLSSNLIHPGERSSVNYKSSNKRSRVAASVTVPPTENSASLLPDFCAHLHVEESKPAAQGSSLSNVVHATSSCSDLYGASLCELPAEVPSKFDAKSTTGGPTAVNQVLMRSLKRHRQVCSYLSCFPPINSRVLHCKFSTGQ
jgi:hypothetical protein